MGKEPDYKQLYEQERARLAEVLRRLQEMNKAAEQEYQRIRKRMVS